MNGKAMISLKNQNTIESLLLGTGREGVDRVVGYLRDSNFYTARCHTHHRFEGGLAAHSLEACRHALANAGGIPRDSVILGTLLHDVCTARSEAAAGIGGHGRRSVRILSDVCGLRLSGEESDAIRLHMHGHAPQMQTNPLARLVWRADKASAGGRVRPEG